MLYTFFKFGNLGLTFPSNLNFQLAYAFSRPSECVALIRNLWPACMRLLHPLGPTRGCLLQQFFDDLQTFHVINVACIVLYSKGATL